MTLRAKLLAAQAPFALVLLVFGYVSTTTLTALGKSPELILTANYRTVLAAERMLDSLEQLQATALARAAGRPFDEGSVGDARRRFESELVVQEHNITEPGEGDATRRLRERWTEYEKAFGELAANPSRDRLARYLDVLAPARAPSAAPRTRSSRSTRTRSPAGATARAGRRNGT